MASARRVVIEFLGVDKSLGRTARGAGNDVDTLGRKMRTVGKLGGLALAAGAVVAARALVGMGKAAAEDQVSQALLARQLKASAGATKGQVTQTEKWITAQGKALGVTDEELRPALAKLARATGDVGEAQRLAALGMDISAGSGKSLESVSAALAKAQNGNVAGLARLGIATKDASGKTLSFAEIQKNLSKQFGGAAATKADTLAGKMQRLRVQFDEAKEAIGARLIPIVSKLVDWFVSKGLPAISRFSAFLKNTLGPVFQYIRGVVQRVMGGMDGDVNSRLTSIKSIFQDAVSIIMSLWDTFGKGIVAFIGPAFRAAQNIITGAFKVIQGIFRTVSALLKGDWKGVWDGIKLILSGAWQAIKGIINLGWAVIKLLFRSAGAAIKGIFGGIWSGIKGLASAGINALIGLIRGVPGRLKGLASSFGSAGKALINAFVNGIKNAGGVIKGIAGNVWNAVRSLLNQAINKINAALDFTISIPGPDIHINAPNIPHLARGGVVRARRGGTLALLGEAGADEAVVPLSGPHAPRGGGVGGDTYNFYMNGVVGDKEEVAKWIEQALTSRRSTLGRPLQFAG